MAGHIWPNLIPVLTVQTILTLAGVILSESGLSFLGIGIPPEVPTWGTLLRAGRLALMEAPHLSFFRLIFIFINFRVSFIRRGFKRGFLSLSEAGEMIKSLYVFFILCVLCAWAFFYSSLLF